MGDKVTPAGGDQFRVLRNNYEKATIHSDIRRTIVGGLNEEDVIKYIDSMRHQYQSVEDELNNHLEEMRLAKEKLRHELENYKNTTASEAKQNKNALTNALNNLSNYQEQLIAKDEQYKASLDIVLKEKNQLADEKSSLMEEVELIREEYARVSKKIKAAEKKLEDQIIKREDMERALHLEQGKNIDLSEAIIELEKQVASLQQQVDEDQQLFEEYSIINQQLQEEMNSLRESTNAASLKGDVDTIYKHLDSIAEQITINDKLQQQLDMEKQRSDKIEKDLYHFSEWLAGIKDQFKQDHLLLEHQFLEIEQKHKDVENHINEVKANLHTFGSNTGNDIEELYTNIESSNNAYAPKCINIIHWRDKSTAKSG